MAFDIGFHMTDWLSDIQKLEYVYLNIERLSSDEITRFVRQFVSNVPNHLNAAMKLSGMDSVTDVFEVGIFEDDDD